nr:phosphogluconate dehydrogenase C-terminal domain-containing protein [Xanthobacter sp. SG618]
MLLDAPAPFAGHLPERRDLISFVSHPCHPLICNDETTEEGRRDYFGVAATQSITSALMQGRTRPLRWARRWRRPSTPCAPILRSYRLTVGQMAIMELGLSGWLLSQRGSARGEPTR